MEENGKIAAQQQTQQGQQYKCTGNCLNCSPAQRAYCASQHAYSNMKVLDAMMTAVLNLQSEVRALSAKIEMMSKEEAVFDPCSTIAQEHNAQ